MNILITCIGVFPENAPAIQYNKGTISAQITSEACCKYLLKKRGHAPDVVIALCTPDAYKESKDEKQPSSYSRFETIIRDFCKAENLDTPVFEIVKISKREESNDYYGNSIYKVRELIQENAYDTRIMIDTSLKAHPVNIMLQMMARLLKNDGYKIIESYYAYPEKERITEDNTNHQLDMVEAISEFSAHGTSEKMHACFSQNTRKKSDPIAIQLMEAMQKFSDSIQLCQTERLQDILNNEIFKKLEEVEKMPVTPSMREDVFILKLMAEDIRKKFGYSMNGDTFVTSPMLLIEWCLKNRYIQQAVTLFVENIPKYLVSSGILQYSSPLTNIFNSPEVNLLYSQVILACCSKERTSVSSDTMRLMQAYLKSDYISEEDSHQIQLFIDTLNQFKRIIGNKRPKNAIYNYIAENSAEQALIDCIKTSNPTSYSKLINILKGNSNPNVLTAFAKELEENAKQAESQALDNQNESTVEMSEIDKKLWGIRNFSMQALRGNLRGIKLNIYRDKIDEFQRFLAYYVYIKKCVRNYLNHAQEYSDELTAEQICEFQSYSVHTGSLTIKNITDNLTEAMQCLNNCIIKNHESIRPVKKYYLTIPKRPRYVSYSVPGSKSTSQIDGVIMKHYHNPMNSPLLDYTLTRFPIIPVIANTVQAGEVIKIYGIIPNSEFSSIWEAELMAELDELLIEKDFDYEYEAIKVPDSSDISASLNLFRTFTETVSEGDKIYADMTCIENQIPISLMMFMSYIIKYRKNATVEAVVYGQYDDELHSDALYDVTKLIYANNEISKLDSTVDAYDALAVIMSYGKQKPELDETDISETDDNVDEISQSDEENEPENDDNSLKTVSEDADGNENITDDADDIEADSEETKISKKYHFSSSSKFRRAVGKFHSDKITKFNRKPIIKQNKHFC